eukprot:30857-Pelagococcus_subviridis.AAC.9
MESSRGVRCDATLRASVPARKLREKRRASARAALFGNLKASYESTNFSSFNFLLSSTRTSWVDSFLICLLIEIVDLVS